MALYIHCQVALVFLKSVTLTFQNLDGSIGEDVVGVEQNVDWHKPIVVEYKEKARKSRYLYLPLQKKRV